MDQSLGNSSNERSRSILENVRNHIYRANVAEVGGVMEFLGVDPDVFEELRKDLRYIHSTITKTKRSWSSNTDPTSSGGVNCTCVRLSTILWSPTDIEYNVPALARGGGHSAGRLVLDMALRAREAPPGHPVASIPKIAFEFIHTQTERETHDHTSWYMKGMPTIDLVVLIKLYENGWTAPPPRSHSDPKIDKTRWCARKIPLTSEGYGPIVIEGASWTNAVRCVVVLYDRNPDDLEVRVSEPYSLIPCEYMGDVGELPPHLDSKVQGAWKSFFAILQDDGGVIFDGGTEPQTPLIFDFESFIPIVVPKNLLELSYLRYLRWHKRGPEPFEYFGNLDRPAHLGEIPEDEDADHIDSSRSASESESSGSDIPLGT